MPRLAYQFTCLLIIFLEADGESSNVTKYEHNTITSVPFLIAENETFNDSDNDIDSDDRKFLRPFQLSGDADDVRFLLFANPRDANSSNELTFNDPEDLIASGFDPRHMTVFIIHGFWSDGDAITPSTIKNAYLDARVPYNIIVVDWGKLSSPDPKRSIYSAWAYPIVVKRNIPLVSQRVSQFVQFLVNERLTTLDKVHLVGHSLGAHISGGVGHIIASNPAYRGKKLGRVTGLDPAGPLFHGIKVQRRLNQNDAEFVDIYHTAVGTLGSIAFHEAHANFFPSLSKIYAASIQRNFTACKCEPRFIDFVVSSICPGKCKQKVLAGEHCDSGTRGQFYFETTEDPFNDDDSEEGSSDSIESVEDVDYNYSNYNSSEEIENLIIPLSLPEGLNLNDTKHHNH